MSDRMFDENAVTRSEKSVNDQDTYFASVEKLSERKFGYLVRYLYAALSDVNGKVPEVMGLTQLDDHLVFDAPNISVVFTDYRLPRDFAQDGTWTTSPKPPAHYDEAIRRIKEGNEPEWVQKSSIEYQEAMKSRDSEQLTAFSDQDINTLNQLFCAELKKLRDFQGAYLRDLAAQVPGLQNFQGAIQLLRSQSAYQDGYSTKNQPLSPAQLREAAVAKTFTLLTDDANAYQDYERMIQSKMLGLDEVLESQSLKREQKIHNELLAQILETYLDNLIKAVIAELVPTNTSYLLNESVLEHIQSGAAKLEDFTVERLIDAVSVQVIPDRFGDLQVTLITRDGQVVSLVKYESDNDLNFLVRYSSQNIARAILSYVTKLSAKTSKGSFDSEVSKRTYKAVMAVKMASVLQEIITVLRDETHAQQIALQKASRIASHYRGDWASIFEQYYIATEITPSNLARVVKEATAWSVIRNGSDYYTNRAQSLGYLASNAYSNLFESMGSNSFSLHQHDTKILCNTSREKIIELASKKVLEITADTHLDPQFIETSTSPRTPVVSTEQHVQRISEHLEPILRLTDVEGLITTNESSINFPSIQGMAPSRIAISMGDHLTEVTEIVVDPGNTFKISLPDWAKNQTQLHIGVEYGRDPSILQDNIICTENHLKNLRQLAQDLKQAGFWLLSESIAFLLHQKRSITITDISDTVKEVCKYSYNSQSVQIDQETPFEGLSQFIDRKSGEFLCQCDSANELLAQCLVRIFDGDAYQVFTATGFQTVAITANTSTGIDLSAAHKKVKVLFMGVTHYFDATPSTEEVSLIDPPVESVELLEVISIAKQELQSLVQEKTTRTVQTARTFSDRTAPIPRMIDILGQIQESGTVNLNTVLHFRDQIDRYVVELPPYQAENLGLNYLPGHLDVYMKMRTTLDAILARV